MYTTGTIRTRHPRNTLAKITPHMPALGVACCQNITHIDRLDIPVFVAATPLNSIIQNAWGKGCTTDAAQTAALMEAVERSAIGKKHPYERIASYQELQNEGNSILAATEFPTSHQGVYHSKKRQLPWIPMYDFLQHTTSWVPASSAYYTQPMLAAFTTIGLSSGNSPEEAMLHGIFEIIERHAICSMFTNGKLTLAECGGRRIPLTEVMTSTVADTLNKLYAASIDTTLLSIPCPVESISVYWTVLYDAKTPHPHIAVSMGYGAHTSPEIAILRAITAAAQSRVRFLHGSNENMMKDVASPPSQMAIDASMRYFKTIPEETAVGSIPQHRVMNITDELAAVFKDTRNAGFPSVLSMEIPQELPDISVRKTLIPGTSVNPF
ncbi:YcaO-like family protein [Halodesulfovibrio sp.]|jgi:ribosomal protein S12 methylthiotransferase accessory factor|uniref:YcaO-like family protein n=1 Tax=Halodesulfovibrio sp. TaxID=1912772 RepID=UPI0025F375B1|nr:YcaO-like family protein [Halodesulfovibrio sp.]MCT4534762.1 YcaO-like family protein [Halodesulfovibrio sp.]